MNWDLLKNLRQTFLAEGKNLQENYWTEELLELYDTTFAERIGWKWDAVLKEAKSHWTPPSNATVVDWGCGTGIATRKLLNAFPQIQSFHLHDKNPSAVRFAEKKLGKSSTNLKTPFVLLLSHVLNELTEKEIQNLVTHWIEKAHTVFWVEPGMPAISQKLVAVREKIRDRFPILAPCPHQTLCPMQQKENASHWCHHFASPPNEVFRSRHWSDFSKELGIDLRSLPVSYFFASQEKSLPPTKDRVIGRARVYKGYAMALVCEKSGTLTDRKLLKRDDPHLLKTLKEGHFSQSI